MYKKEGKRLLPSLPSNKDNTAAQDLRASSSSLLLFPMEHVCGRPEFNVLWASHSQEEIPEELGLKNFLLLTTHFCRM